MKFYIASGFGNVEPVRALKKILDDAGWEHTYDWTSVQGDTLADTASVEINAVCEADVVVVLLPGGRGTHAELGCAIGTTTLAMALMTLGFEVASSRRIVLYTPDPEKDLDPRTGSVFYHHPLVERFSDYDKMIASLLATESL